MTGIVNSENLSNFAYSNDHLISGSPRGIVLAFSGLGDQSRYDSDPEQGRFYASRGLLFVIPYANPWAWMNRQTLRFTDEIVSVLNARYGRDLPVASTGGSMGGLSAIVYTAYSEHSPIVCVANCPVCDLPYHYSERPDLPRTLYSAFGTEEGAMSEVLARFSPLHLVDKLPRIPYHLFHCAEDRAVLLSAHSAPFTKAMQQAGHEITLEIVPDRGHCDLTPDAWARCNQYILDSFAEK